MSLPSENHDQKKFRVVLDTNILYNNWLLRGPSIDALEKLIRLGLCELVIPQVVVQEAENCFREETSKVAGTLGKFNKSHGEECLSVEIPNVEAMGDTYGERLQARLGELGAVILPYEDIPHEVIIARAISARKPFRESGKGYRDTLVWEGVLGIAQSEIPTLLVTKDKNDFHDKEGGLHEDLEADLESRGLSSGSIQIFQSLPQLVRDFVSPFLERSSTEAIQDLREGGSFRSFSISKWFEDERDSVIGHLNQEIEDIVSDSRLENPEVLYVEDPQQIEVVEVYSLEEETALVQCKAIADVIIDVFVFKGDTYAMDEEYALEIQEFDWNDHYAWAQLTLRLPIDLSITLNVLSETVVGFEIEAGETFGWCRKCGAAYLSDAAEYCYRCGGTALTL